MMTGTTHAASPSKLNRARVIGTVVVLAVLLIAWRSGARWAALPILVMLIAYHFVLPRLVSSRVEKFNREAIKLLTSGQADKIPSLAGRSVFLQLFAPAPALSAKLALAYVELGDHRSACSAFENALRDPAPSERLPLELGYAKSLFICGKTFEASKIAERLLKSDVRLPELLVFVARERLEKGDFGKQTRSLIEQALELSGSPESCAMARLADFELKLRTQKITRAGLDALPASAAFVLGWREALLGLGDSVGCRTQAALEHFEAALSHIDYGFVADIAKSELAKLGGSQKRQASTDDIDRALRRKRKKRR